MLNIKRSQAPQTLKTMLSVMVILLLIPLGCSRTNTAASLREPTVLRIGFGLAGATNAEIGFGFQQAARNVVLEGLFRVARDGRPKPNLAEGWSLSDDGLTLNVHLRPSATFHSGNTARAQLVREVLEAQLPSALGPAYEDILAIRAPSDVDLEFSLRERSTFLIERLDVAIQEKGSRLSGTGPFSVASQTKEQIELQANPSYYGDKPSIDRVVMKPYTSVRSAWADMLRGQLDMLYEVGVEGLDSLEPSNRISVFPFQRGYAFMMLLNVRKPALADPRLRRALNAAIDRTALIGEVFRGRGTPAAGPVWPHHWAYDPALPQFEFQPEIFAEGSSRPQITCIFVDPSHERLALALQRQLRAIGVDLNLEAVPADQINRRLEHGDFDAFLADFIQGPNLVRPYLFWHSGSPFNYGHYRNLRVDAALDRIRHASDDSEYKQGVATFQRAIIEDPPAVFLAWRERARAVSRRFDVPTEPGADVISSLHLWRPTTEQLAARGN